MSPQDVPIRLRVTLYPQDQATLADLAERLDVPEGQVIRDALAAYRRHLDLTARLRGTQMASGVVHDEAVGHADHVHEG